MLSGFDSAGMVFKFCQKIGMSMLSHFYAVYMFKKIWSKI